MIRMKDAELLEVLHRVPQRVVVLHAVRADVLPGAGGRPAGPRAGDLLDGARPAGRHRAAGQADASLHHLAAQAAQQQADVAQLVDVAPQLLVVHETIVGQRFGAFPAFSVLGER